MFGSDKEPPSGDGDNMSNLPPFHSEIDKLFEGLEDDKSFTERKQAIKDYVDSKKIPATETNQEVEGGKKKRKSKKKTKKMKKSKKSKTAKKKKH